MSILINNLDMPLEDEQINLTILSDGTVIEHFQNESGKWSSYKSGGVTATELPPHGGLKDFNDILTIFDKVIHDVDDDTNALLCDLLVQIQNAPTVLEAST